MRKATFLLLFLSIGFMAYAQENEKVSTVDFVQVLHENKEEALFYYQNNWKVLREMAIKKGYIHSFQLLETPADEESPFHFMLITTYLNQEQYDRQEENFSELIKEKGELRLLNEKKPSEFRKILFHKGMVKHWD